MTLRSIEGKGHEMEYSHPPVAKKVPVERVILDKAVMDEYRWLEDRSDPDTPKYIEAENAYARVVLEGMRTTKQALMQEMVRRTQNSQNTMPERKGSYSYYTRTLEGLPYPVHVRMKLGGTRDEVVFDTNNLLRRSDPDRRAPVGAQGRQEKVALASRHRLGLGRVPFVEVIEPLCSAATLSKSRK